MLILLYKTIYDEKVNVMKKNITLMKLQIFFTEILLSVGLGTISFFKDASFGSLLVYVVSALIGALFVLLTIHKYKND